MTSESTASWRVDGTLTQRNSRNRRPTWLARGRRHQLEWGNLAGAEAPRRASIADERVTVNANVELAAPSERLEGPNKEAPQLCASQHATRFASSMSATMSSSYGSAAPREIMFAQRREDVKLRRQDRLHHHHILNES